ncbi:unnamed protein product [Cladocopium goreaui]|uniref:C3H1-type domain-containing protein n=1 Tax=Cladocopium goreaui TaxID=2562237 RepID=A0A9P1FLF3_9DINO|nr:unnamed protein product [Cladocopium goreaui]
MSDQIIIDSLPGYSRLPCNQCFFFSSAFGCRKGAKCAFCHHQVQRAYQVTRHNQRQRIRRSMGRLIEQLDVVSQQPQEIVHRLQIQALRNPYARTWCQRQIDQALEQVEAQYQARGVIIQPRRDMASCGAKLCFSV